MNILETLENRRSVRKYQLREVPREAIEKIVNAGRLASTARNVQPCRFIVVTGQIDREKLAEIADYGRFIREAGACVVVVAEDTEYYLEDGSAATENILLAATALGLGSCWVAGDKKPYAKKILDLLDVPEGYRLVSMVSVGYPDGEQPAPDKKTLSEVLHWERFGRKSSG